MTVEGPPVGAIGVGAMVERACAASGELALSADDVRESGSDIPISLPEAPIDLSQLTLGEAVVATVRIDDGSYELAGVASDAGESAADDPETGQGELAAE